MLASRFGAGGNASTRASKQVEDKPDSGTYEGPHSETFPNIVHGHFLTDLRWHRRCVEPPEMDRRLRTH
jgi:hypothetical protein